MQDRSLSKSTLLLIPCGILVNYALSNLILALGLPLFFDSIGTILAAALGGYLPGVVVGFCTNLINGIQDPITLYYGAVNVLIALLAGYLARRRVFCSIKRTLLSAPGFALIGGALGSLITWMLYGFHIGGGVSSPLAALLNESYGLSPFWAQMDADIAIDLLDKLITLAIVYTVLRLLPDKVLQQLPWGHCCTKSASATEGAAVRQREGRLFSRHSIQTEVLTLILGSMLLLGTLSVGIGYATYRQATDQRNIQTCTAAANLMEKTVSSYRIEKFMAQQDSSDPAYREMEQRLMGIRDSFPDVAYLYVYQIDENGCRVVFDLDTEDTMGKALGTAVEIDPGLKPYLPQLLRGEDMEPVVHNGPSGRLLTLYRPIRNTRGECVAYAIVDMAMETVIAQRYVFIIKMVALLFGVGLIVITAAIWYADKRLIQPINALTQHTGGFADGNEEERSRNVEAAKQLQINTGNELEQLYQSMVQSMTDIDHYIATIRKLQSSTLFTFANLVECRGGSKSQHIRRTAELVEIIAIQLREDGSYAEILTDGYIADLKQCAPLHDVGKITVSDGLLMRSGDLTPQERTALEAHTIAGKDIIEELMKIQENGDYLKEAQNMAAYHHEWWNGAGYPKGLSGVHIPLSARIMAVADAYDDLVSGGVDRAPVSLEVARAMIVNERGTRFDPGVTEAFFRAFPAIRALYREDGALG